jgi:hypothetical protein
MKLTSKYNSAEINVGVCPLLKKPVIELTRCPTEQAAFRVRARDAISVDREHAMPRTSVIRARSGLARRRAEREGGQPNLLH